MLQQRRWGAKITVGNGPKKSAAGAGAPAHSDPVYFKALISLTMLLI